MCARSRGGTDRSRRSFDRAGDLLAVVTQRGEARVFSVPDGKKVSTLKTNGSPLFAVSLHPVRAEVAVAGMDGMVRIFDVKEGVERKGWESVPLKR